MSLSTSVDEHRKVWSGKKIGVTLVNKLKGKGHSFLWCWVNNYEYGTVSDTICDPFGYSFYTRNGDSLSILFSR